MYKASWFFTEKCTLKNYLWAAIFIGFASPSSLAGELGSEDIIKLEYKMTDSSLNPSDPENPFKPLEFREYVTEGGYLYSPFVEVQGITYFPKEKSNLPIIVILHGRHNTCTTNDVAVSIPNDGASAGIAWPCYEGSTAIPSYKGYDYLGTYLAKQGYFVVSISANGVNALEDIYDYNQSLEEPVANEDEGKTARARLINHHLNALYSANTYGTHSRLGSSTTTGGEELARNLKGRLDFQRIGLIGHSRGGEGVISYARFTAPPNNKDFNVRAVLTIGSTNTHDLSLKYASLGSILPYCDGDVSDLQSARIFDNTIALSSKESHYQWTFMGANHNVFNTEWSGDPRPIAADNWLGTMAGYSSDDLDNGLLPEAVDPHCGGINFKENQIEYKSRGAPDLILSLTKNFAKGFFNSNLKELSRADKQQHLNFLIGKNSSGDSNSVKFAYQIKNSLRISLGGDESYSSGVNAFICGGADTICEESDFMQYNRFPHITPYNERDTSIKQIKFIQPADGGYYHQSLLTNDGGPIAVNHFTQLQFRVATNQKQEKSYPEFQVQLIDVNGASKTVAVDNRDVFRPLPGDSNLSFGILPKSLLHVASVSLDKFEGLDLSQIVALRFIFQKGSEGGLLVSDISFSNTEVN